MQLPGSLPHVSEPEHAADCAWLGVAVPPASIVLAVVVLGAFGGRYEHAGPLVIIGSRVVALGL